MSRGSVAAKVREHKEQHPEQYCYNPKCLWRVIHLDGRVTQCPKHVDQRKEIHEDQPAR